MRTGRISVLLLFFVMLLSWSVKAQRIENVTEKIDAQGIDRLDIDCEFGLGELVIHPESIKEAAILDISYNPRKIDYNVEYTKKNNIGFLVLESVNLRKRNNDGDKIDNTWDLTLSTQYASEMTFKLGACEADIDLGGIPLTALTLKVGAASGIIEFTKVNPVRMRELVLEIGASSMEVERLGNANFDNLKVSCGAASCDLDLRGDYKGESEIAIDVGVGSVDLVLPRGVAVDIEADEGMFSSIEFHHEDLEEIDDDHYQSPGFDKAEDRIYLSLEVGIGSIDIYWK